MEQLALYFVSPKCATKYFINHDFLDVDCGKELISKCLGYAIVVASCFVKFPQILKILSAGNAQGVSFLSQFLDVIACAANFTYCFIAQYPFSAYGDAVFNFLQTLTIAHLCVFYAKKPGQALLFSTACVITVIFLCSGAVPLVYLKVLNSFNIFIVIGARGSQILTNLQSKSTGQLSFVTMFLLFAGCIARIFTSIQETNDFQLVMSFATGALLNGLILLQILMYAPKEKTQ